MSIKYHTDDSAKIAEIWVTDSTPEAQIAKCRTALQAQGYYCVIFRSGREDLLQNTTALLKQNLYLC